MNCERLEQYSQACDADICSELPDMWEKQLCHFLGWIGNPSSLGVPSLTEENHRQVERWSAFLPDQQNAVLARHGVKLREGNHHVALETLMDNLMREIFWTSRLEPDLKEAVFPEGKTFAWATSSIGLKYSSRKEGCKK